MNTFTKGAAQILVRWLTHEKEFHMVKIATFAWNANTGSVVVAATSTRRYIPSELRLRCVNGSIFPTNTHLYQLAANARPWKWLACNVHQIIVATLCVWLASTSVSTLISSSKSISRKSRRTRTSSLSIRMSGVLGRRGERAHVCAMSKSLHFSRSAAWISLLYWRVWVILKSKLNTKHFSNPKPSGD